MNLRDTNLQSADSTSVSLPQRGFFSLRLHVLALRVAERQETGPRVTRQADSTRSSTRSPRTPWGLGHHCSASADAPKGPGGALRGSPWEAACPPVSGDGQPPWRGDRRGSGMDSYVAHSDFEGSSLSEAWNRRGKGKPACKICSKNLVEAVPSKTAIASDSIQAHVHQLTLFPHSLGFALNKDI